MKLKYTKEILEPVVKNSTSYAQVLESLNLYKSGGNYKNIKCHIDKFSLDTSHFKGQGWSKGVVCRDSQDYLKKYDKNIIKHISTDSIKKKILQDKIMPYKCNICGLSEWIGNPIPLELHHKDGDRWNNEINNLEIICPNCHTLTDNYKGKKNKGNGYKRIQRTCKDCGINIYYDSIRCRQCNTLFMKEKYKKPYSLEEIKESISKIGICATAGLYKTSRTTIRKWLNRL